MSRIRQPSGPQRPATVGRTRPVFLDRTGRRRRAATVAGAGIGALLVASLIIMVAGLFTGSSLPLPGWPDSGHQRQDKAGAELSSSPHATPTSQRSRASTAPGPALTPGVSTAPQATLSATQTTGQGALHRASPASARASKTPGKPK